MEPASPSSPILQKLQQHQLTAAARLVYFYKLGPNGLGCDKLDDLFTKEDSWYYDDFVLCYRIRSELERTQPTLFWDVIRELNETNMEGVHQPIPPNECRPEPTAQALDDPTRNRSASTNSQPESNRLKRAWSDDNGVDGMAHTPLPGVSTDPNSKRRTYSSKGTKKPDRFCPGPFQATGQGQCRHAQTPRKYKKYWVDACYKDCLATYRLKPKVNDMKFRCVAGCNHTFKNLSELTEHMWCNHMDLGKLSSSSHTQNQVQTANHVDASSAREGNVVPGISPHPSDLLSKTNGTNNGTNGAAPENPEVRSCSSRIENQAQNVIHTDVPLTGDGNVMHSPSLCAQDHSDTSNGNHNAINGSAFDDLDPKNLSNDLGFDTYNTFF